VRSFTDGARSRCRAWDWVVSLLRADVAMPAIVRRFPAEHIGVPPPLRCGLSRMPGCWGAP